MNVGTIDKFLEQELAELQVIAVNFANRFIPDAKVRRDYYRAYKKDLNSNYKRN